MKKVYTIQITSSKHHPNIWYAGRINQTFQAKLSMSAGGYVVYAVDGNHIVHTEDCVVLGVREVEQAYKDQIKLKKAKSLE